MPIGWIAPAPTPWISRNAIIDGIDQAKPHSTEPTRKIARPPEHHRLAADAVGQLAEHHRHRGLGQQEGREHPAVELQSAELADDLRHRGRDDRRLDGDHEHCDAMTAASANARLVLGAVMMLSVKREGRLRRRANRPRGPGLGRYKRPLGENHPRCAINRASTRPDAPITRASPAAPRDNSFRGPASNRHNPPAECSTARRSG